MLNTILIVLRTISLIFGGHEQVALENLALREQLGIFSAKRASSQNPAKGSTVLGVLAKSLERVEVCISDCPARNRAGLATETFQTLLVPIIPAQESRSTSEGR